MDGKTTEATSVNHVDLESNTTPETESSQATANGIDGSKQATATREDTAKMRRNRNRRRNALFCGGLLAVASAIVVFITVFCMRDPEWEVVDTHIDPAALAAMSMAVGMGSNTTTNMTMTSTVRIYNPNFIGAVIDPEAARVTCHGEQFATSRLDAFTLRRRSTTVLTSEVSVSLSPTLAPLIVQDVMTNSGTIIVYAKSEAIAHTGIFRLRTGIECKIWADMMPYVTGGNDVKAIKKKECTYWKKL
jgi:catabolite regulation protein CreA